MEEDYRIVQCQKEIRRLRAIVREYSSFMEQSKDIDYRRLFEIWAEFADSESADEVTSLIDEHGLGPFDGGSFTAFCFGYEKAMEDVRSGL